MITFGSLFAGIGGIDLGLERAGMVCKFQVEINDYCQRVLAKHWPDVPRFGDVRSVGKHNLTPVDVLAGGFPCQDLSNAGRRAGIGGERSGLWAEYARIIGELRPRYVIVENVPALLNRGMDRVCGDLATLGYDAEWDIIPAAAVAAPHLRERLFIIAYPQLAHPKGQPERPGLRTDGSPKLRWRRPSNSSGPFGTWPVESGVGRVAYGIPTRLDQLRGLGNAVVPQCAEYIGRLVVGVACFGERRGIGASGAGVRGDHGG